MELVLLVKLEAVILGVVFVNLISLDIIIVLRQFRATEINP